jgi:TolB-like protein/Tfp pilus assembly protein PilF
VSIGIEEHHSEQETRTDTSTGVAKGTPAYWAPEILEGKPATKVTDIWALGVLLYELACSKKPFQGATVYELAAAILDQPPAPLPPNVPATFAGIIRRCLEKEPERRYPTAADVRDALEKEVRNVEMLRTTGERYQRHGLIADLLRKLRSEEHVTLAVLPFDSLSNTVTDDSLTDGMSDAVINALARLDVCRVISWMSVRRYKGSRRPLKEIARELGANAIVVGTALRYGEHVRINAQLINPTTDGHVWADSYIKDMREILQLQTELAREIADCLAVKLTSRARATRTRGGLQVKTRGAQVALQTVNAPAYDDYLKGKSCLGDGTEHGLLEAITWFRTAVEKDRGFALAYAELAASYVLVGDWVTGILAPHDAMPKARKAAEKALRIDDTLAKAHACLAWVDFLYERDWKRSEKGFRRAIELNPSCAIARSGYALQLTAMARLAEADVEIAAARAVDPVSPSVHSVAGLRFYFARGSDRAIELYQEALKLEPDFVPAHIGLGWASEQKVDYEGALTASERAAALSGRHPAALTALARIQAISGHSADVERLLAELTSVAVRRYVSAYELAVVQAGLHRIDEALALLDHAVEERAGGLVFLKVDPRLDPLRSEPRFLELLRRTDLAAATLTSPKSGETVKLGP